MAAASAHPLLHPPAPCSPGQGPWRSSSQAFEDISSCRRAWRGGKNGGHPKAKIGPRGPLQPEAAGLRRNTRPSLGGHRPVEPSDLDEQRSRRPWSEVLIRFHIQRNVVVIPKSVTPSRIQENIQVFDFQLSDEEMATILSFNRNWRACGLFMASHLEDFPFHEEY